MVRIKTILAVSLLSGCSLLQFPQLNAPKPPETSYQYNETFEKNPTAVVAGGKVIVVENQSRTVTAGYVHQQKELSFWQRFCNWLAGWSLITVLIVFGCLAFGITGPAMWLWSRLQMFKKTTVQIVKAIDEAKIIEKDAELKSKLSATLDNDSKRLVDDIKRG